MGDPVRDLKTMDWPKTGLSPFSKGWERKAWKRNHRRATSSFYLSQMKAVLRTSDKKVVALMDPVSREHLP